MNEGQVFKSHDRRQARPPADTAYLDHNATAPLRPEAKAAMVDALDAVGNASSVHAPGRAARARVEAAREAVAALVGAPPAEVIFTASGTEANNQALRATGRAHAIVTAIEHDSVLAARSDAVAAPVTGDGTLDLAALAALLDAAPGPALVSVMLANNETGAIQPVAEAASLARARGALVHCDAVQAAGRIPVDMAALGVDYLTLSAHKIGGPPGAGALVARRDAPLDAFIRGGGQESGLRAGTENVPAIAGFGAAARAAAVGLGDFAALGALRDAMEARLRAVAPVTVFAAGAARLPNTCCVAMPGVAAETQVMALDLDGVAVSAGAACSSGRIGAPRVLLAMGAEAALASCAIRISLGWSTTQDDIDRLVGAWERLYLRVAQRAA